MYYSFSGKTRKWAQSRSEQADIVEIKERKKRGIFSALFIGCPQAISRKRTEIEPVDIDFDKYEKIVLAAPIWAGFPAPAFNGMLSLVPKGKTVQLVLISGTGNSSKSKEETIRMAQNMGLNVEEYIDINEKHIVI